MDNQTKRKIWLEIIEATKKENQSRRDDEYTVYDFIRQVVAGGGDELKRDRARKILDDLVKQGKLTTRRAYLPEHRSVCTLYSPRDS